MTYSIDFRQQVLWIKEREQLSFDEVAERFGVGRTSVVRWSKQIEAKNTRNKPATKIDMEKLKESQGDWCLTLLPFANGQSF